MLVNLRNMFGNECSDADGEVKKTNDVS